MIEKLSSTQENITQGQNSAGKLPKSSEMSKTNLKETSTFVPIVASGKKESRAMIEKRHI